MELEKDVSRKREEEKDWWGAWREGGLGKAGSCRSLVSLNKAMATHFSAGFSDLKRNSLHEPGVRKFLDTLELGFECG